MPGDQALGRCTPQSEERERPCIAEVEPELDVERVSRLPASSGDAQPRQLHPQRVRDQLTLPHQQSNSSPLQPAVGRDRSAYIELEARPKLEHPFESKLERVERRKRRGLADRLRPRRQLLGRGEGGRGLEAKRAHADAVAFRLALEFQEKPALGAPVLGSQRRAELQIAARIGRQPKVDRTEIPERSRRRAREPPGDAIDHEIVHGDRPASLRIGRAGVLDVERGSTSRGEVAPRPQDDVLQRRLLREPQPGGAHLERIDGDRGDPGQRAAPRETCWARPANAALTISASGVTAPIIYRAPLISAKRSQLATLLGELGNFRVDLDELEEGWQKLQEQIDALIDDNSELQRLVADLRKRKAKGSIASVKRSLKSDDKVIDLKDFFRLRRLTLHVSATDHAIYPRTSSLFPATDKYSEPFYG